VEFGISCNHLSGGKSFNCSTRWTSGDGKEPQIVVDNKHPNVLFKGTTAVFDYNDNGIVDAADYTVWRDR